MRFLTTILVTLTAVSAPSMAASPSNDPFCYDADKVFKRCQDQNKILEEAKSTGGKQGKLVLVVYGYETCPWSNAIVKALNFSEFAKAIQENFVITPIAHSTYYPSGKELLARFQDQFKQPESAFWGVPILVLINPKSDKGVMIELAPFERNTDESDVAPPYRGYHVEKVVNAINEASAKIK